MSAEKHLKERTSNRFLLIFYDILFFILCIIAVFVLHPSSTTSFPFEVILIHGAIAGVCIFACRFVFKIYRMIWRFGSLNAYVRLMVADMVGGGLYLIFSHIAANIYPPLKCIIFLRSVVLVALNLLIAILARMFYYYLWILNKRKSSLNRLIRTVLRVFALVDVDSEKPGAVLRIVLEPAVKSAEPINDLLRVVQQFAIRGEVTSINQINKGYINRTYRVETLSESNHVHKYLLQRINTNVFPDVDALMDNFVFVTNHLHGRLQLPGDNEKGSVQMVRVTKDGRSYFKDDTGSWRMLSYFDGVYSLDIPDKPEIFRHAGHAFGTFVREMRDVEFSRIHEVIPNFHNTMSRYRDLEAAIAADPVNRVKDVQKEIEFVRAHAYLYGKISQALESGEIPLRICHNDCNLNNILFDNETHLPVAIIDLDTVMPSSPLYDYGDSMRIGTNTAQDDEKDLSKVSCDLNLYEQYARGYLQACGDILTTRELELLPYASLVITSEDGIRFLMDHINGDTYYHIFYPGQNLDRARTQLKLLEDMESKLPEIRKILTAIYKEYGLNASLKAD